MSLKPLLKKSFDSLNSSLGGLLSIFARTYKTFLETNASESAASVAYYALFSLFPLLLILISVGSSILINQDVQQEVLEFVEDVLPAAQELVRTNIQEALNVQGSVQIASMIGLLWAASGVFNILAHNINRAWHIAEERNFLTGRLIALGMVAVLITLVILWLAFTTVVNLLPLFNVPLFGGEVIYDTYAWSILSRFIPSFFLFFAFLNLYRWVPKTKVKWREVLWGALLATIGFELTTRLFSWYLTSGLSRYQVVYGSLGAVVALMLWLYLSSMVVLIGAHLSAAIAFQTRLKKVEEPETELEEVEEADASERQRELSAEASG